MAGLGRTRVRDGRRSISGFQEYPTLGIRQESGPTGVGNWEECIDVLGNREGDNAFTKTTKIYDYPVLNSEEKVSGGAIYYRVVDYPLTGIVPPGAPPSWNPTALELTNLANLAAANTNPSVPHVSLPAFLGEGLEDLPRLVRAFWQGKLLNLRSRKYWESLSKKFGTPEGLLSGAARANLSYRFFWKPLLSDLLALVGFTDAVNKRLKYLNKLRAQRSVKRRMLQGSVVTVTQNSTKSTLWSTRTTIVKARRVVTNRSNTWSTCRWNLMPGTSLPQSNDQLVNLAKRLVLGLTSRESIAAAWELFPWSWLVDWFIPIGRCLAAGNNTVPVYLASVCVMRSCSSQVHYTDWEVPSFASVSDRDARHSYVTKIRRVVPPSIALAPVPSIPFLTEGQLSILGSLMALRVQKRN